MINDITDSTSFVLMHQETRSRFKNCNSKNKLIAICNLIRLMQKEMKTEYPDEYHKNRLKINWQN